MNLQYLKTFIKEKIQQYPELKSTIIGYYELCLSEIEEGGSETQEVHSAIIDINDEIEDYLKENKK